MGWHPGRGGVVFFQFFFIPYYPFWALTLIAIDIFMIWALATAPQTDEVV